MSLLPDTVAAVLAGRAVRCAKLVHFDFADDPQWVWDGFGPLSIGGHTWSGLGQLGSISGIAYPTDGSSSTVTFTLSATDPAVLAEARTAAITAKGRDVTVSEQFFTDDLVPLDQPVVVFPGIMDLVKVTRAAGKSATRSISVTAEPITIRQSAPPYGLLSDADQKAMFPTDRGLEAIAGMQFKTVIWPPPF